MHLSHSLRVRESTLVGSGHRHCTLHSRSTTEVREMARALNAWEGRSMAAIFMRVSRKPFLDVTGSCRRASAFDRCPRH
ncbi:hypothetical protein EVAR_3476_1 [Eumeta japonica]|uniref:Uncharacterized protein n=1 Tax=Eumeta variegata TaxID=151549 RepID=A0A4C1SVD1_EUMVA|nr:hypothetical protein EVAR_3476_1 [Eumeta japonica]